jgi:hypothetical protein
MKSTKTIMMCVIDFTVIKPYIVDGIGMYETEEQFLDGIKLKVRQLKAKYEYERFAEYIEDNKLGPMDPHWDGEEDDENLIR